MMAILPYTLRHNKRSLFINLSENFYANMLVVYKTVSLLGIVSVCTLDAPAQISERLLKFLLHLLLHEPAFNIWRRSKVSAIHLICLFFVYSYHLIYLGYYKYAGDIGLFHDVIFPKYLTFYHNWTKIP